MKTLRIRTWLLVGILIFLALTVLFYHFTDELEQRVLQPWVQHQAQQQDAAAGNILREVASSPARWHDPGWQRSLRAKLDKLGVGALILAPSGAAIFRSGPIAIAISTAGASPALAKRMRNQIADEYGEVYARLAELLNEVRGWAKGTLPTYNDRKEFFETIVNGDPDPIDLLRQGDEQAVRDLIAAVQASTVPSAA